MYSKGEKDRKFSSTCGTQNPNDIYCTQAISVRTQSESHFLVILCCVRGPGIEMVYSMCLVSCHGYILITFEPHLRIKIINFAVHTINLSHIP